MSYIPIREVFRTAMKCRLTEHPFDRISAYKIRECRDNLQHNLKTVCSIAEYLRTPRGTYGHSSILVGCTEEDKAYRLKSTPVIIACELGYNFIPAVEALTLEGVSTADIDTFIISIQPRLDQLLTDCDAVQMATVRSIKPEYNAMKAGNSGMEIICTEAFHLAERAVAFCEGQGVL